MNEEKIELEYERAPNTKRIAALALDLVLSFLTGAILLILTFFILSNAPGIKEIKDQREQIGLTSRLYVKDEGDNTVFLSTFLENSTDLTIREKNEIYESNLYYFFENKDFFTDDEGRAIYLDWKKDGEGTNGERIFDDQGNALYQDAIHEEDYSSFYSSSFNKALGYLHKNTTYASLNQRIILIDTFSIIGTLLFPFLIFFYGIPLFFPRTRQTLGMLATRIGLIDVTGLAVRPMKFTLRFLFFYVVEVWGSLLAFLIPAGLSLGMMAMSKSHQSLHDYLFNTYVVNIDQKMIFKDVYEYRLSERNHQNATLKKEDSPE